jgi:hypothetical protein
MVEAFVELKKAHSDAHLDIAIARNCIGKASNSLLESPFRVFWA